MPIAFKFSDYSKLLCNVQFAESYVLFGLR